MTQNNQSTPSVVESQQKKPTSTNMPPASTMAANNSLLDLDPFGQFGQLSLDADNKPSPETPPSAPKTDALAMTSGVPGMNGGYEQQQQQPMQVSPEQVQNPGNFGQQQQQQMYQQQQPMNANNQYNSFGQPAQMQYQQQTNNMTINMQAYPNPNTLQAPLTSPPISPLTTPASPEGSPEGAPANNLPTGFGNAAPQAGGAPVPTLSPRSPGVAAANPFDMFAPAPTQAPANAAPVATDPFATNVAPAGGAPVQQPVQEQTQQDEADFWNNMGFGVSPPSNNNNSDNTPGNVTPTSQGDNSFSSVTSGNSDSYQEHTVIDETPVTLDDRGLPAGGEYYKARVTTPMLGAIFSSAKELRSTLFKTASNSFVEAIGERPVISFTIDGSAADTAGIELGHVLLKVNDIEVSQTDEAVKTVGAAARPMTMEFYIPNKEVKVLKTEAQCMVKYDNHSTEAPASACEWKPKYVVVGDMLGKPHILYMYRSKVRYMMLKCHTAIDV